MGNLDALDFNGLAHESAQRVMSIVHVVRLFPFLTNITKIMPLWLARNLSPGLEMNLEYRKLMSKFAAEALDASHNRKKSEKEVTVFDALAKPSIPENERSSARIEDEALVISIAASETVARTLTIFLFFVLKDEQILQTLKMKLQGAMTASGGKPTLKQLETLKYLAKRYLFAVLKQKYADLLS